ncbi:MAG: cob(I)yrinic acid a,c-diamide adenosyltransferase [Cytophagales bacterium]|nr:cob(I)yrinic acid a,c-diamide adenosyltransferase [Cytophagales bacterium]
MSSKVYTKTGDKGQTSLLGGKKVSKSNARIEAYGNVDELNSFLGYLKDHDEIKDQIGQQIQLIQRHLFSVGSILATAPDFKGFNLPQISEEDVTLLENWIDTFDKDLPELKNFIIPGGHKVVSLCHVCRTVCRRAERNVSALAEENKLGKYILPFLNRLSDYLFVMARTLSQQLKAKEIPWTP